MRLVLRYTKEERVKYISHLDLMRTLQRAFRRADIPIAFSQGFNPHPRLAFASALAVGVTSEGEYMDVILEGTLEPGEFCTRMNEVLPKGIRMLQGIAVSNNAPSLMSVIERADYLIKIPKLEEDPCLEGWMEKFLMQKEIMIEKRDRKGIHSINIRDMIHRLDLTIDSNEHIILEALISSGSKQNLKPDILAQAFLDFIGISIVEGEALGIHRINMYLPQGDQWITPLEME